MVTSPGFLRPLLLEAAGVPLNAYESFLFETAAAYPAMNAFGCFDASGQGNSRMEDEEGVLEEYQYLVYQNVFDKKSMGCLLYTSKQINAATEKQAMRKKRRACFSV